MKKKRRQRGDGVHYSLYILYKYPYRTEDERKGGKKKEEDKLQG